MENLLALFNKIQQVSPLSLFEQEHVIVQNAGMQHWLNMSIAESRGIAMNLAFSLPAQYLWKLLRSLASDEEVPDQSPYSREVLVWRIYQLLISSLVTEDESFAIPTNYWQQAKKEDDRQQKRYQLALKVADLYEQYLIFRPEWIDNWSQANFSLPAELAENTSLTQSYHWQGKLWHILQQQQPYNPKTLLEVAIANLSDRQQSLPKRIAFFGINALAPMWLNFLEQLGKYTDIHFFHLNPCADYWGDIQTEKQHVKHLNSDINEQLNVWTDNPEDISAVVGNPLLANWGQQGREFLSLLQQISTINIDVFEQLNIVEKQQASLLSKLQQDILTLNDARTQPARIVDNSLTVTSCHSAFREVQALHDWLLHQLENDKSLTPKDILVMCPEIEHYAPYVHAVFTRGWQEIDERVPPLPCSIADRSAQDADPLIATFVDLLSLPDNRFHVSSIIAMLRLEAVQKQFNLSSDDISTICFWLEQAAIHWGLDATHKKALLNAEGHESYSNAFTWQQGLSKLLHGFAFGDQSALVDEELVLPFVEGGNSRILGQLMLFLHTLKDSAKQLSTTKTAVQWHHYLISLLEKVYHPSAEESVTAIAKAIGLLSDYNNEANNQETLSLVVVKEFLSAHFSMPDAGRQFMVGQVTFCSMLPMRSIPFRIIAVLGLNDGEYPRQRQPLAFDLMAMSAPKLGDRSRRGDDRYLFLEALISTREKLYLSYQGRNVQNNKEREPSIILQELFDYLTAAYQWQCKLTDNSDIRQMPLQAFSEKNYLGEFPSFDANWLKLAGNVANENAGQVSSGQTSTEQDNTEQTSTEQENTEQKSTAQVHEQASLLEDLEIDVNDLVRFFQHPSKWYAQRALSVYFEQNDIVPSDIEQFTYDRLASYQLKQQLLAAKLSELQSTQETYQAEAERALKQAKLSGRFADTPLTEQHFDKWLQDNDIFTEAINACGLAQTENLSVSVNVKTASGQRVAINANLPIATTEHGQVCAFYRSSTAKAKDLFTLYLSALVLASAQVKTQESKPVNTNFVNTNAVNTNIVKGLYFDTKSQKVSQYNVAEIQDASAQLSILIDTFLEGQHQPLLHNTDLAHKYFNSKSFEQTQLENYWYDSNAMNAPGFDPYIKFFWHECPPVEQVIDDLTPIYQEMYRVVRKA